MRIELESIVHFYSLGPDGDIVEVKSQFGRDVYVRGGKRYTSIRRAIRYGGCGDPAPIGDKWIARRFFRRDGGANYHFEA